MDKIKVLVVDDSMLFRMAIQSELENNPELEVVATAKDAYEARDKIAQFHPDVMTLDVQMPKLSGIDFLKIVMKQSPMPVIMVSSIDGVVFEAMNAGAVDFVAKPGVPASPDNMKVFYSDLSEKIKIAYRANLKNYQQARARRKQPVEPLLGTPIHNLTGVVALGASTGGTEATSQILKKLPAKMPGMVIVQHMPPVFTNLYAERLNKESALEVREAKSGDVIRPGLALIAPGDKQMTVHRAEGSYMVRCQPGEKVSGHCPSVDVLFSSVAKAFGREATGIILTGMGADGARGMKEMREAGAYNIGQDKASSVVYGMPQVAFQLGAVNVQAGLENIPSTLIAHLRKR